MPEDNSELWKEALEKARTPRKLPAAFNTIRVTETSDELIEAFKQASFACGAAEGARIQNAYSHMNVTAETLYTYIAVLEQAAGHSFQPIIKRF